MIILVNSAIFRRSNLFSLGPFKHQSRPDSTWGPVQENMDHFKCGDRPDSDALLVARKYQLMDLSVQVKKRLLDSIDSIDSIYSSHWLSRLLDLLINWLIDWLID